jgi:hypothetical protein
VGKIDIIKLIDDAIIRRASLKTSRNYMGASGLGEKCDRKLWYSYKLPETITDPRINRIFDLGNNLEDVVVKYMRDAGLIIHTHDENGEQFGFVDGIIAGHCDGVLETPDGPVMVEFKTFNTKRFENFKKVGIKESDPKYYTQIQVYIEKFELNKGVVIGIDKNDCELHIEWLDADPIEAHWAINRGKEIGNRETEPDRGYGHKSSFQCKLCNYRAKCWADVD